MATSNCCVDTSMRALEHFVIMANTCNSFTIHEYFLDLKRIMMEYNMYQTVYRAKFELYIKDSTIGKLREDIHMLMDKTDRQTQKIDVQTQQLEVAMEQLKIQSSKLSVMSNLLIRETDNKVVDVEENTKKQELVVLQKKATA